ncbi:uroporphyrinogen-III synthase [Rhizobium sp. RU35A]|uniref:uroporphyrinogen-III synthase n=1 Tax=Rhizobium sp. RU35A TaxID=1907414 RepID=UPI000956D781|nr:uroporphyrinogen-III synthase [Rhizobium sp. RU35A]SIQ67494.1 uroporphyrinogen-III synthase [Rhizobium sp. RU35A]
MRVIVTRPSASAGRTAEKLRRLGHEPILLPVTEPVHHSQAIAAALTTPHSSLAITSAEAVRALIGLDLTAHYDTPVFAVGAATAEAARQAGFHHVEAGTGTGEALARLIIDRQVGNLLYLAGDPRSPAFEAGLARAGIKVSTVVAYAMREVAWGAETVAALSPLPEALLLYSKEAARHVFRRLTPWLNEKRDHAFHVLCLSPQVAEAVPQKDMIELHVADQPDEDQLLLLLSSCGGTKIR